MTPSAAEEDAEALEEATAGILEACGPRVAVHLRLPGWSDRRLYGLAARSAERAGRTGGWCVVNGRADIALAAGAQGVQLGRTAPPVAALRPHLGGRLRVGVSVHGPGEALAAVRDGANFLILGTIFSTPSHPGREGAGPGLVAETAGALRAEAADRILPLVAIGGIDASRVGPVLEAGAVGVAVRRAVWEAGHPAAAARILAERIAEVAGDGVRGEGDG